MFTSNAKGCHSMIVLRDTVVSTRLSHVPCALQSFMFTSNAKGCHSMIVLRDTVVSTRLSHVPCALQCAPSLTLNFGWEGVQTYKKLVTCHCVDSFKLLYGCYLES